MGAGAVVAEEEEAAWEERSWWRIELTVVGGVDSGLGFVARDGCGGG